MHIIDDEHITTEELGTLRQAFNLYDHDHDGVISRDEFGLIISSLQIASDPLQIQAIVRSVDRNSDHKIDFDEFVRAMVKWVPLIESSTDRTLPPRRNNTTDCSLRAHEDPHTLDSAVGGKTLIDPIQQPIPHKYLLPTMHEDDELVECFNAFDKNGDGQISQKELEEVMVKLGEQLSRGEIEDMMKEADKNGDGHIDYGEFKDLFKQAPNVGRSA